ncbi:DUF2891 domain-containing protein [Urechidicola sp. P050]|uniref:DUF2891 domain-containing protein n=2 Tax=Urechidicola vernalis TaxID=3075600 RepID=A0ABU2Y162_9FLAO|nr:DUF2891 domain-containing protein [Urechidicola sp. P050]MDT0551918.1 DUF2891 domain-containing protein [Urechidicola sp. P050]
MKIIKIVTLIMTLGIVFNSFSQGSDQQLLGINLEEANKLVSLPLNCIQVEYPNKLNQTLGTGADIRSPKELHPAFYGCFDWHSAVHGHWSMVALLRQFPNLDDADLIKKRLLENISKENIALEMEYFEPKYNKSFERTYGWAWLLKLAEEIKLWDDPVARKLEMNLEPLVNIIIDGYIEFLPKLNYPIRVGEHSNTAFGLSFAYDFALTTGNEDLKYLIEDRSRDFFINDTNCPISWEPSGFDFLSPCLEEMNIMRKVLPKEEFKGWILKFLPELQSPEYQLAVGEVSDRSDGKLVHLDGVNFSRAWCLLGLANQFKEYKYLEEIAFEHINYSLPNLVGDNYEGSHWLGSFAIYALKEVKHD